MITHIKDPDSDKIIVFIHGLGGSKFTWYNFTNYFNKKWSGNYGFLLKYFPYYRIFINKEFLTRKFKKQWISKLINTIFLPFEKLYFLIKILWSKRNTHNVELLDNYITKNCKESRNVIIVAHSMGGLIARQFLINCKKSQIDIKKYRMLITYATPHKGSNIADKVTIKRIKIVSYLYTKFSIYFNYRISPQIGDLASLNEFIQDIEADWSRYNVGIGLNFIRVVAKNDFLVKPESAMQNDKEIEFIKEFEYDHGGIINPMNTEVAFEPINYFIEKLNMLEYKDEIYEELIPKIDYYNFEDSENIETY